MYLISYNKINKQNKIWFFIFFGSSTANWSFEIFSKCPATVNRRWLPAVVNCRWSSCQNKKRTTKPIKCKRVKTCNSCFLMHIVCRNVLAIDQQWFGTKILTKYFGNEDFLSLGNEVRWWVNRRYEFSGFGGKSNDT